MKENTRSIKISRLQRKIDQIDQSIAAHRRTMGSLEAEKTHWKFVLEHLGDLEDGNDSDPIPKVSLRRDRIEFTSLEERWAFIVRSLKEAGKEMANGDLFKAQISAGIKTTKMSHDSLLSRMTHSPNSHVGKGTKQGFYIYIP